LLYVSGDRLDNHRAKNSDVARVFFEGTIQATDRGFPRLPVDLIQHALGPPRSEVAQLDGEGDLGAGGGSYYWFAHDPSCGETMPRD
jgi:hypothetical protein